jgi:hypothetical protein
MVTPPRYFTSGISARIQKLDAQPQKKALNGETVARRELSNFARFGADWPTEERSQFSFTDNHYLDVGR